ncbi:PDDEXK nuclease domain-containing protein [Tannockella kyphosi]|uniref:PDDEXK nuclease domain-containing protein n=1 Tax=Tannockella kyphosi TaxID=2899121 RepID=UPI0020127E57|nr:PDDEXK nuclease domain-containing protein [Tannockella kyphosi]
MNNDLKIVNNEEYQIWINDIKRLVHVSQLKAAVQVNTEMIRMYLEIGKEISQKKVESVWGIGFYRTMSFSMKKEFPDVKGFSVTNLKYMKRFYEFYCLSEENRQQLVDDLKQICMIPWGHHILIMTKCKDVQEAIFYVNKTIENGWSRSMLLNYLSVNLYAARGKAITNFEVHLPEIQSDLAKEAIKDPYNFDFITLTEGYREKELEDALTSNITKFLLELGQGFAYIGRQQPLVIGEKEVIVDLLFYHMNLRCYIVIDLKIGEFDASHLGQIGTYVVAINHQLKKDVDNPTIGLIICKTKDNVMAQYAVEASSVPIGISEYQLSKLLPTEIESALPSIEDIEQSIKKLTEE